VSPQINDDIFSERINKSKSIKYYGHSTPESNQMSISQRNTPNNYIKSNTFDVKSYNKNYRNKTLSLPLIPFSPEKIYTLLIHLDDTIIHIPNKTNNIFIRNFLIDFINIINPYYEIISFTNGNENYSEQIINLIETKDKYFDYCLHKDNATYLNEEYFKDINKLGRNIKKTIIIDEVNNNLGINNDNTIYIKPFILNNQNDIINKNNDCILKNLSNVLIDIAKEEPDDVRKYLRMNKREIMNQTC
jgi:TFIIF-interacting CTD phosphatase-like protein